MWCGGDLSHEEACFSVQQLALGARVEQEGVAAEGEGPVQAKLVLGLVMGLPPGHIVVLHIQLLTASQGNHCKHAARRTTSNNAGAGWGCEPRVHRSPLHDNARSVKVLCDTTSCVM